MRRLRIFITMLPRLWWAAGIPKQGSCWRLDVGVATICEAQIGDDAELDKQWRR